MVLCVLRAAATRRHKKRQMDKDNHRESSYYCGACSTPYQEFTDSVEDWIGCERCDILFVLGLTLHVYQKLSIVKIVKTSVNILLVVHALYQNKLWYLILLYVVNCCFRYPIFTNYKEKKKLCTIHSSYGRGNEGDFPIILALGVDTLNFLGVKSPPLPHHRPYEGSGAQHW